jgi:hypothetical protein
VERRGSAGPDSFFDLLFEDPSAFAACRSAGQGRAQRGSVSDEPLRRVTGKRQPVYLRLFLFILFPPSGSF